VKPSQILSAAAVIYAASWTGLPNETRAANAVKAAIMLAKETRRQLDLEKKESL
jgi:hypothetical protein